VQGYSNNFFICRVKSAIFKRRRRGGEIGGKKGRGNSREGTIPRGWEVKKGRMGEGGGIHCAWDNSVQGKVADELQERKEGSIDPGQTCTKLNKGIFSPEIELRVYSTKGREYIE
jgi:hypothetical protein